MLSARGATTSCMGLAQRNVGRRPGEGHARRRSGSDKLQCGQGRGRRDCRCEDKVSADCETVRGPPALPSISIGDASVRKGLGTTPLSFEVTLSSGDVELSVVYATADGTAKADSDYAAAKGTLAFFRAKRPRRSSQVNETRSSSGRDATISLSGVANATIADGSATGTITTTTRVAQTERRQVTNGAEHERLECARAPLGPSVQQVPEPALNFPWKAQRGTFAGSPIPSGDMACPTWFREDRAPTSSGRARNRKLRPGLNVQHPRRAHRHQAGITSRCGNYGLASSLPVVRNIRRGAGGDRSRFRSTEPVGR